MITEMNSLNGSMRVADYIFRALADRGLKHIFLVTGGGAMHLNDAFGGESKIKVVF
jgi:acetolactate synthase-1/2/3 large subunit